jgi:hypothetical protein
MAERWKGGLARVDGVLLQFVPALLVACLICDVRGIDICALCMTAPGASRAFTSSIIWAYRLNLHFKWT